MEYISGVDKGQVVMLPIAWMTMLGRIIPSV